MLQNNPYKLTSQVTLAPDPQLTSMMEKYKASGDAVAFSVVFNEIQRRKEVRDAAQAKMAGGPKQKVADQLIQEAKQAQMPARPMPQGMPQGMPPGPPQGMGGPQGGPPPQGMPQGMPPGPPQGGPPPEGPSPQGLPEDSGIAQLPASNIANMAGGGIVSFAGDGPSVVPFDSSLEGAPHTMRVPYYSDETVDENADEGGNDHPRFDARDPAGDYRKTMEELFADQERQNKEYETKRAALGEAYANAEDRDKELSQRYADEERFQKGMPWISAGLALMQSTGRGISGLADAGTAGISALVSGREKLASLKDKQRDYMQTVTEARRAEKRGDLDKLRELQVSLTGQRANMAGVAAQLGQSQNEINSRYAIAKMETDAKGQSLPGTDKLKAYYEMQANDAEARNDIPAAEKWRGKLRELADTLNSANEKRNKEIRELLNKDRDAIGAALAANSEDALKRVYATYADLMTYSEFKDRIRGLSGVGGGADSGGGQGEVQFGSLNVGD